jgi:hypothetical protein
VPGSEPKLTLRSSEWYKIGQRYPLVTADPASILTPVVKIQTIRNDQHLKNSLYEHSPGATPDFAEPSAIL